MQFVQIIHNLQSTVFIMYTDCTHAPEHNVYTLYFLFATSTEQYIWIARTHKKNNLYTMSGLYGFSAPSKVLCVYYVWIVHTLQNTLSTL